MELHWLADESASCFHAVECLIRRLPLADPRLTEALAPAAASLASEAGSNSRQQFGFLSHLVPLSAELGSNRQLATVSLTKTFGHARALAMVTRVTQLIDRLEEAFDRAVHNLADELAQNSRPLRDVWKIRGNSLMAAIAHRTEPELLVDRAKVLLVYPAVGGAGQAHLLYNSVRIECAAADPVPQLPEVLRLAWLLSQLNADLPRYQGEIHRDRLTKVAALAMIPVVLSAAQDAGITQSTPSTVRQAVEKWQLDVDRPAEVAESLDTWWETYQDRRPSWTVALAALDQLLE